MQKYTMKKLRPRELLLSLTILLICLTTCDVALADVESEAAAVVARDFRTMSIEEASEVISETASPDNYTYYKIPNGWNITNDKFWNRIHLKLSECKNMQKETETIIREEILVPQPALPQPWYQHEVVVVWGTPIVFSTGLILGYYLFK